jgi:hypothetical protein
MQILKLSFFVGIFFLSIGCGEDKKNPLSSENIQNSKEVTAIGVIQKQGFTCYMYGTHKLCEDCGDTRFALKSSSIDLDIYIDRHVRIKGELIENYPVSGGPEYVNVTDVELVKSCSSSNSDNSIHCLYLE